ncbi:MAG TPA: GAF domain-containing protein, partial [Stellaceae bacterium]|nr:GAF domain-containing protein [Stellaceae bacterium]
GIRSWLAVALQKDGVLLGVINAHRHTVRPFTGKQIALLQNFAAQAVIAMENARLLTETGEALEQQTATAEVLQVINSSPGDLAPVFAAMVERAARLCEADEAALRTFDGELLHLGSVHGSKPEVVERLWQLGPTRLFGLYEAFARGETIVHFADVRETDIFRDDPVVRERLEIRGIRSWLAVALQKEGVLFGVINVHRHAVRPFTGKQIALLQNFAAQAVIAMENARLLTETREALEQQTATAEVLQVINSSPGDLAPVFDAILEKAHSLCGVAKGSLELYDGKNFRAVATRGLADSFAGELRQGYPASDNPATRPLIEGQAFTHILDRARHKFPFTPRAVDAEGAHTLLCVPLRRDDKLLGMIAAARLEVRPFTDKQIALLQSFAAQAVVAMDNARLLDEIRQRQAELRVTFDNMGDGVAMFDGELRLAAWNRNFQQILGLPDEFIAGRPSAAEFIRHLATHGEFGVVEVEAEVRRLTETLGAQWSAERTRPDGRVIEVRHNPVPDGGFVLIYSDITERQRAEAQIRAARDAAEKALRELKMAQASLIHAEKMASLGQLTAGIAHEIKNPLNFVNNFAGLSVELLDELKETTRPALALLGEETRAEAEEIVATLTGNLDKIAEHGRRADGIVTSMLAHSRGGSGERQKVDVNALVDEALNLAYHGARAQDQSFNIALERDFTPAIAPIDLVPQDITRALLNLIGNGFYAASRRHREGGTPSVKVTTRDFDGGVEIRVRDNGTGIAPELRDKLFQPFFTTKPTGEGTGLGLSISYDIVTQQHGGTIEVDSAVGEFAEFTIRLPRRATAGARLPTGADAG